MSTLALQGIEEIFRGELSRLGFYDVLLPWLLFFAIFYGLLWRTQIFKGVKAPLENKLYVIVAVVLAFFVINFVPPVLSLGAALTNLFGQASIVLAGLLVLILFVGMMRGMGVFKEAAPSKRYTSLAYAVLVLLAIVIFVASGAATALGVVLGIPPFSPVALTTDFLITIFMILIIVGVVVAVALGGPKGEKEKGGEKAGEAS